MSLTLIVPVVDREGNMQICPERRASHVYIQNIYDVIHVAK